MGGDLLQPNIVGTFTPAEEGCLGITVPST